MMDFGPCVMKEVIKVTKSASVISTAQLLHAPSLRSQLSPYLIRCLQWFMLGGEKGISVQLLSL